MAASSGPAGSRASGGEGRGDEGGEVREREAGILRNGRHQLRELPGQSLNKVPSQEVWLEQEDSAHMVTIVALPQAQLWSGRRERRLGGAIAHTLTSCIYNTATPPSPGPTYLQVTTVLQLCAQRRQVAAGSKPCQSMTFDPNGSLGKVELGGV